MERDLIASLAEAAADAYCKPDEYQAIEDDFGICRGFLRFGYGPLISIRGTANVSDALADGKIIKAKTAYGGIHAGFLGEFEEVYNQIERFVYSHEKRPIHITGHSLGGAIATIVAVELAKDGYEVNLCTFGSPRVGDADFADTFKSLNIEHTRVVHADDIVPRFPKVGYRHVGTCLHLDTDGKPIGPIGNAFRWLLYIDKILKADLSGKSFVDHKMVSYLLAVTRYAHFQERKGAIQ